MSADMALGPDVGFPAQGSDSKPVAWRVRWKVGSERDREWEMWSYHNEEPAPNEYQTIEPLYAAPLAERAKAYTNMLGRSLSSELQRHLLGDSVIGPLGDLTGEVWDLWSAADEAGDLRAKEILSYVHERVCRARHEIAGDKTRKLPPAPTFHSPAAKNTQLREKQQGALKSRDAETAELVQLVERLRQALFMCAASCQGGHSTSGKAASDALGVPYPVRMEALIEKAVAEGRDPNRLWPWTMTNWTNRPPAGRANS